MVRLWVQVNDTFFVCFSFTTHSYVGLGTQKWSRESAKWKW